MRIPHVYSAEELEAKFLAIYSKCEARGSTAEPALVRLKRLEVKRITNAGKSLASLLRQTAVQMPYVDKLHPFYRELLDVVLGVSNYKHATAKVGRAHIAVRAIAREAIHSVKIASNKREVAAARGRFKARVIDLIRDLRPELEELRRAAAFFKRLPAVDPNVFTVVVAGAPNVGKSSFVRCVSSAKPQVGEYPFTTRQIHVGHAETARGRLQVVDTPGLLDRPLSERNAMERQAILALRHLARVVLFIVDPTPHSGFQLEMQKRIFDEIATLAVPVVAVVNKIDIATEGELERAKVFNPVGYISTLNCLGTREVLERVIA